MADQDEKKEEEVKEQESAQPTAESKKSENGHMIPQSRLNEETAKRRELEAELARRDKADKKATDDRLLEQQKFEELAESRGKELAEANAKAAKYDDAEETIAKILEAQVEQIPEDKREMIPKELSAQKQLDWIAKNKAHLTKSRTFDTGAGARGGSETKSVELTTAQREMAKNLGQSDKEYAEGLEE